MRDELRERRERTWEVLVELGVDYGDAVSRIAQEFDCAEGTVKSDISRMDSWIRDLDVAYYTGISRLRELRSQRQRLNQMAMQAQQDEDLAEERKIRKTILDSIIKDIRASQKLGLANEEPTQVELASGLDPEDEDLVDEFAGIGGEEVDLEEMR